MTKTQRETLAVIDAPHFYAGVVMHDDRVQETAPILKYMVGWDRNRVREYCTTKGWKPSVVNEMSAEEARKRVQAIVSEPQITRQSGHTRGRQR